MRKFNVNVNGNSYVVEVEEVGAENTAPVVSPVNAVAPASPAPVAKPAAPAPAPKPAVTGGTTLKCPMPGKVLKLLCKDGDKVAKKSESIIAGSHENGKRYCRTGGRHHHIYCQRRRGRSFSAGFGCN